MLKTKNGWKKSNACVIFEERTQKRNKKLFLLLKLITIDI